MEEDGGNGVNKQSKQDLELSLKAVRNALGVIEREQPGTKQAAEKAKASWLNRKLPKDVREGAKKAYFGNPIIQLRNEAKEIERKMEG